MFAVDRIRIVAAEAAVRAVYVKLRRAKHHLDQTDEEGDPENHDGDGEESSRCAWEGDVPESGGRQGRDGEVERVCIVRDRRIHVDLSLIDQRRHDENENAQVENSEDDVLVPVEEGEVAPESLDQLVRPKQSEGSSDSQKGQIFTDDRGEQGGDDDDIGHAGQVCELTEAGPADRHTGGKVS